MGGLVGTLLMLLEASGVGATVALEAIPRPAGVPWERWLLAFPSYGFLFAVPPENTPRVRDAFAARGIAAGTIGRVDVSRRLTLVAGSARALVWDLAAAPLTGFGAGARP